MIFVWDLVSVLAVTFVSVFALSYVVHQIVVSIDKMMTRRN